MRKVKTDLNRKVVDALNTYALQKAAALWQRAEPSDPFAGKRIMHYMRMGFELPSDVIAVASARLAARGQNAEYHG